jgi:hypothetical protein
MALADKLGLQADIKKKIEEKEETVQALSPPLSPRRLPFGIIRTRKK